MLPRPRLYLVPPPADEPAELARTLGQMLDAADVAAVLLRLPQGEERTVLGYAQTIAPVVQAKGAALLLDGRAELVARADADGAHLTGIAAFTAAVTLLKPQRIAGAGGLATRHDAMLAGEGGADYVMFGDPIGRRPRFDLILERVAWWAALFEVPCVGYAATLDEVSPLTAAGADFVALGEFVFTQSEAAAGMIQIAAELAAAPEPVK